MNTITKENIKKTVESSISVVYQKFQFHCKEENKTKLFCFFEGKDAPYYSSRIKNYFDDYINFKCNNKANVIKLYKKINNKKSDYLLAFFIDRDFDDSLENPDIYETPTYSIENLYCTILEKEIDRRNFRKKMLSFEIIEETDHFSPLKSGRPAKLFRFNIQKYKALLKKGFHFEIKFA